MTEKELRKLKRRELLELLLYVTEDNDSLTEENDALHKKSKQLKAKGRALLAENEALKSENADLRTQVNSNAKSARFDFPEGKEIGSIAEAALQISGILEATQTAADLYMENVRKQAESMLQDAQHETEHLWTEIKRRLDAYCAAHDELRECGISWERVDSKKSASKEEKDL